MDFASGKVTHSDDFDTVRAFGIGKKNVKIPDKNRRNTHDFPVTYGSKLQPAAALSLTVADATLEPLCASREQEEATHDGY